MAIFYIIRCYDECEEFYKLGITSRTIKLRYPTYKTLPYDYEIVLQLELDSNVAWDLEKQLKKYIKDFNIHYLPLKPFKGSSSECYKYY